MSANHVQAAVDREVERLQDRCLANISKVDVGPFGYELDHYDKHAFALVCAEVLQQMDIHTEGSLSTLANLETTTFIEVLCVATISFMVYTSARAARSRAANNRQFDMVFDTLLSAPDAEMMFMVEVSKQRAKYEQGVDEPNARVLQEIYKYLLQ